MIRFVLALLAFGLQDEFDVVSIKPAPHFQGALSFGTMTTPGVLNMKGVRTRDLIARAYSLKPYQVSGPAWLDNDFFDIVAKAGRPVTDAEQRLMLRSMLASRFDFAAHLETRELPCYHLLIHKGKAKLRPAKPDEAGPRYFPARTSIVAKAIPMSRLADLLTEKVDRPVLDRTALSGAFDLELKWRPDTLAETDTESLPSIYTALQEQLGLKLEPGKAPVDVLVIDRIQRPSRN